MGKREQRRTEPVTAEEVRVILKKGPLTLAQLGQRLNAVAGARRRSLVRLVKKLLQEAVLQHDGDGIYGLVTKAVKRQRQSEQTPSVAEVAEVAEKVPVLKAGRSAVGMLNLETRYPHVQVLSGELKGRVNLAAVTPRSYRHGDSVSVRVLGQDRYGLRGTLTGRLARGGGAAQAAETLLATHDVPRTWPEGIDGAVAALPKQVTGASFRGREDLRSMPLVTIDGERARDFDDAVFAERAGKGWRLVVAIADVAHYVKRDGVLDRAAVERGNSVYLPDRVVPMLPEALSNGLCSLRPEENRLVLVCDMRISAAGRISGYQFYEAVLRSWARLTYTQVGACLAGDRVPEVERHPEVLASIEQLYAVFAVLRQAREERGALDFEGREAIVELAGDTPVAVHRVQRNDAHKLIEEAMIAANVCAARLLEAEAVAGLYRIHEPPPAEKVELLRQGLAYAGIRLPDGTPTPKILQEAIAGFSERTDGWVLESLVLRSLSQACYTPSNKGHFGLALQKYMHFTSPIRRYADLQVHRAIKLALKVPAAQRAEDKLASGKGPRGAAVYSLDALNDLGAHLSQTERRADEVSWAVDGWLKCEFMLRHLGDTLDGVVMGVTEFGLFVELKEAYVQGLVHISELGQEYFQYQALSQTLIGERSGARYGLGDPLKVTLMNVDPPRGRLALVPVRTGQRPSRRGRHRSG